MEKVLEANVMSTGLSAREERSAAYAALQAAKRHESPEGTYTVSVYWGGSVTLVDVKITSK